MEKETKQWPEKLRFNLQMIGFVGAIITSHVSEVSWWTHATFMFLLLLSPMVHLLVSPIHPTEFRGRALCEKLAIMLLAFSWGHYGFWSKIWCDFVVSVIVLSNWIYELHKVRPNSLHPGLETRKAEVVDENKKELEVEEAQVVEEKKEESKVEEEPENHKELDETCISEEQKPENQNKLGGCDELKLYNLIDLHLSKFSEEIIKRFEPFEEKLEAESNVIEINKEAFEKIGEELEAESNHSAFYQSEFEKMKEKFEEKEREFEKMKEDFEKKEKVLESKKMKEKSFEEKERELEVEKMKEKFEEKERELESMKTKEKSFDEKASELEKMREKFDEESNHSAFYKREFEKMKEKFEEKERELESEKMKENSFEEKEREFEKMKEEFEEKEREFEKIIEKFDAESNHSAFYKGEFAFYKGEFEKMKEKFEEKERELESEKMKENSFEEKAREFEKMKADFNEKFNTLRKTHKQIEKLKEQLEEYKLCDSRDCHHYSSLVAYYTQSNISLAKENSELKSKVCAMSELEDKIAGLESQIADLNDKLYIAYSTPRLFQKFDDDNVD